METLPADQILDGLSTAVLLVELDGSVHYVNGAAQILLAAVSYTHLTLPTILLV